MEGLYLQSSISFHGRFRLILILLNVTVRVNEVLFEVTVWELGTPRLQNVVRITLSVHGYCVRKFLYVVNESTVYKERMDHRVSMFPLVLWPRLRSLLLLIRNFMFYHAYVTFVLVWDLRASVPISCHSLYSQRNILCFLMFTPALY